MAQPATRSFGRRTCHVYLRTTVAMPTTDGLEQLAHEAVEKAIPYKSSYSPRPVYLNVSPWPNGSGTALLLMPPAMPNANWVTSPEKVMPYSDSHGRVNSVGCVLRVSYQLAPCWSDARLSCANAAPGSTHPKEEHTHVTKNTVIHVLQWEESITPIFSFVSHLN